jgi:homoserine kinase
MPRNLKSIEVFAPATVANLACGFDILGMSIAAPGDVVRIQSNASGVLRIRSIRGDKGLLSKDPLENTVTVSMTAVLNALGEKRGFDVWLHKQMPLGSGLGSSAASSAAGAFAVNQVLGRPFNRAELVAFAMEGERVACGTAHPDNVAPCLMGGIVLCHHSGVMHPLPVPRNLFAVVIHPHVEVLTRDSRAVLPSKIDLKTAVRQWSNTAALTAALYENNTGLMRLAMQDFVAEPARKSLIPHFDAIKEAAMEEAIACSISGSGPSVFAVVEGEKAAHRAGERMQAVCRKNKLKSDLYCSRIDRKGVRIISQS